ncbi:hypothetical protein [uncultured Thiocystis sp.]|uniref:hypothetical protein n=1 Tax=uncultured Thiocystis sp. TaxID=1202134 RepID=UPI0025DA4D52|nr:hypothetical protein [uncultured Thiocystis sp.]
MLSTRQFTLGLPDAGAVGAPFGRPGGAAAVAGGQYKWGVERGHAVLQLAQSYRGKSG